jgi:hypothetical protein
VEKRVILDGGGYVKKGCVFVFLLLIPNLNFLTAQAQGNGVREVWVARYDGPENKRDGARAMAVDASGNVYVTGESLATSWGSATIKYDPEGREVWVARYEGRIYAIAVDTGANVYVAGQSPGNNPDYVTIKYDSDGEVVWIATYAGPGNSVDFAWALALDAAGNVYVTGSSWGDNRSDFGTIKYDPAGNEVWVARYNGPQNLTDIVSAIAIDPAGNVYVTGESAVIVNRFFTIGDRESFFHY